MRLTTIALLSGMTAVLAGCNDTLDSVGTGPDVSRVSNKVEYQLSGEIAQKMRAMGMPKTSPIMVRIFKEEGTLEVWKAKANNRFDVVASYKICAWSGKLGPKMKEGDRQAPEGFYPLKQHQLNPYSKYYLAINTGFPNRYDQANARGGSDLMIHGACSSAGCYSMTDGQILEIFALARDAFKGGQETIQLQAFPFRMTAENMARHRDNPHYEFWKMLKTGYDHFEVTKRPPEVNVCEKKYVFNQQTEGNTSFNAAAQCPAMSTPAALQVALASYNKTYDRDYEKAASKLKGMVWYEPSEAERKAIVAQQRKGRELAYAPTGSSFDAGKLMKAEDLQKQREAREAALAAAEKRKLEAAENAKLAKVIGAEKIPVPAQNPGGNEQAAVETKKPVSLNWKFWKKSEPAAEGEAKATPETATQPAGTASATAADTTEQAKDGEQVETTAAAQTASAGEQPTVETADSEQKPKKRPFWKLWGN